MLCCNSFIEENKLCFVIVSDFENRKVPESALLAFSPDSGEKCLYSFYLLNPLAVSAHYCPLTSGLSLWWSGSLLGLTFQLLLIPAFTPFGLCVAFSSHLSSSRCSCSLSPHQVKFLILIPCLLCFPSPFVFRLFCGQAHSCHNPPVHPGLLQLFLPFYL